MTLETGKISSIELTLLLIGFTAGPSLLIIPGQGAGHDGWLAIIVGLLVGLIIVSIFTSLAIKFPGKSPIDYNDIIYGSYLGKFISVMQLWFFLHVGALVLRNFGDFFISIIFPETPMEAIIILTVLICASAVRNGIEVITRCSPILIFFMVLSVLGTALLLFKDMKFTNFLPIFEAPLSDFFKASLGTATFPFGDTVAFLMVIPFLNNVKETKRSVLLAIVISAMIILLASIRNIASLGVTGNIATYSSFQSIRLVNIGDVLTRLEILVAINLLTMGFIKISILYYGTVLGTAQLLKLHNYLPLVFPIGIIMTVLSIIQFDSVIENFVFNSEIGPYYTLSFQLGIPLLSLSIAIIRGLPKSACPSK